MTALADAYRAFLFDVDGVLTRGDEAIPAAPETLASLRARGARVGFVTNNSSKTPEAVAAKLWGLGIAAAAEEVSTSAGAAVALLAGTASSAFVIGEEGVRRAIADAGIAIAPRDGGSADAVVVGWDRSVDYDALRVAAVLVGRGARFVATNADASFPAPGGELWPGAGALVAAIERTTGVRAEVAGKPELPLFEAALARLGEETPLVVGDRLETDLVGATRAGLDGAVVFSGVSTVRDLLDVDAAPVAALADVGGLLEPRVATRFEAAPADAAEALLRAAGLTVEAADSQTVLARDAEGPMATAAWAVEGRVGYLHSVAVREDRRGSGTGALATAAAVRGAAAAGAREILLLTEDAGSFFAALGFSERDREGLPGWVRERSRACSDSAIAMGRPLGSGERGAR